MAWRNPVSFFPLRRNVTNVLVSFVYSERERERDRKKERDTDTDRERNGGSKHFTTS